MKWRIVHTCSILKRITQIADISIPGIVQSTL